MIPKVLKFLALTVLGVCFAVIVPSSALALSDEVQVQAPGNSPTYENISLAGLGSPITRTYSIGGGNQDLTGYELKTILDAAAAKSPGLSLDNVTAVQIDKPKSQGQITITKADFTVGTPLFYAEDGAVKFVYPGGSRILTFKEATPGIKLVAAQDQSVAIVASPDRAKVGETVKFAAGPEGNGRTEKLTETWSFGDGTGSGTKSEHRFSKARTYTVSVRVTGDQGFDASTKVSYVVGKKKKEKEEPKEDEEQEEAPPASNPYSGGFGGYDGYSYPGGTGGGTGTGTGPPLPPSSPQAPQAEPDEPVQPIDDGLVEVSGELVSSSAPAEVLTQTPGGAPDAMPAGIPAPTGGIADWVWVTLGLMGLIAFGVVAERRGSRLR